MQRATSSRLHLSADDRQYDLIDIENPPDQDPTRRDHHSLPISTSGVPLVRLNRGSSGFLSRPIQGFAVLSPIMRRSIFLSLGCIFVSCQFYFLPGTTLPALIDVAVLILAYFLFKNTSRIDLGPLRNREGSIFFNSTDELSAIWRSRTSSLAVETLDNGIVYAGEFKTGIRNGRGVEEFPQGRRYGGDWVAGVPHGYGVENLPGLGVYLGQFLGHMRTGYGKMLYFNGDEYMGQWLNGDRHGIGRHRSADGSTYEGQFVQGRKQGYGEDHNSYGHIYQGQFHNDKRTGMGIMFYSFGDTYEGSWHEDQMEGHGIYTDTGNNKIESGKFTNGIMTVPMPMSDSSIERAVQRAREASSSCRKLDEIKDEVDNAVFNAGQAYGAAQVLATRAHSQNGLHPLNPRRITARALPEIIELFQAGANRTTDVPEILSIRTSHIS